MIPKRFIRIWIGGTKKIPLKFEEWWDEFKKIHPNFEFITLTDYSLFPNIPEEIKKILKEVKTCAGVADIMRILALYELGGIYIDTDVMPLKSFEPLLIEDTPFLGKRSSKSFESAIIGSPKGHEAFKKLIDELPEWYAKHKHLTAPVQTGPAFISKFLFGRQDVRHLPEKYFYAYKGFMGPKREEKKRILSDKSNFPKEMYCVHMFNHKWGGRP